MGGLTERRKYRRPASRLCSRDVVVNGLRFFWVVTVIWCEVGTFFFSLRGCKWPAVMPSDPHEKPAHILLITDVQVRPPSSISRGKRRTLRQYINDLNLRKSWKVANRLKPHGVIFLGDMLASGKYITNGTEYQLYYQKFKDMLPLDPAVDVWYLPGNNDVDLGTRIRSRLLRRHFTKNFSPLNLKVTVKNHTLLLLDAPGLVEEDYQRTAHGKQYSEWDPIVGGPVEFVNANVAGHDTKPIILFSHIPLSRPETKSCGPFRERGTIRRGVGTGYQNTLGKETTTFLLETLRPSAVFSGDNRDYCDYTHVLSPSDSESGPEFTVREVTVKSFSLANQIRRPGFQMLSIVSPPSPPSPAKTFADRPCFLPDQHSIYSSIYVPFLLFTIILLLLSNVYRTRRLRTSLPTPISLSPVNVRHDTAKPIFHLDSVMWSPFTPVSPHPNVRSSSPRNTIPPSLRTPNGLAAPTLRAFSRPSTPHGSPLLSPVTFPHDDDDDDESMYPAQYAMRRESHDNSNSGIWAPVQSDDNHHADPRRASSSHFLPAPGVKSADRQRCSWSRTFIIQGRRLHMSIRAPEAFSLAWLKMLSTGPELKGIHDGKRRGIVVGTVVDGLAIAWPAIIVWIVIAQWIF